ncbi:hypothetical protein halTADL_3257 [Halohasta litchfieldiae]|jgi:hypothetical protein|uniref:Uncharacterized protein n=1 Tax=Halohasta litchfieldiae TaxID=1073996 RepID=A0A1H6SGK2_9EURY|nr:hypothetical protein [Halohasta litchfieldiae]ATW89959.1 hypothetical protein halTADL_3257 [Halohasta litchfieldiae]SEI66016.1 hypothetical protein SAMN05444271_10530 [Halohasta litchfieldiae]
MHSALGPLIRQRLSVSGILKWTLVLGGIFAVTRNAALVVGLLTAAVITETVEVLNAVPGVDERWVKAGFSVVFLGLSCFWLWADLQTPTRDYTVWFPILAVVGGLWLLLDTRADFVQGHQFGVAETVDAADDLSSREAMLLIQHTSLVADHLGDRPKTIPELATECDLTESRVREAIEIAGDDGTIYPTGESTDNGQPRYTLDDRKMGVSGFGRLAAGGLSGIVRRAVRPFVSQFS